MVAHEISHSWTGNLVTNATWEHFWLNEGWTMFLERKIIARVHGRHNNNNQNDDDLAARDLHALSGWKALEASVDLYGHSHPFTKLYLKADTPPCDPDDAFSSVPYEKV